MVDIEVSIGTDKGAKLCIANTMEYAQTLDSEPQLCCFEVLVCAAGVPPVAGSSGARLSTGYDACHNPEGRLRLFALYKSVTKDWNYAEIL